MRERILLILLVGFVGIFVWRFWGQNLRSTESTVKVPAQNRTTPLESPTSGPTNTTGLPLSLPSGFAIAIYARNVPDARVLEWDPQGKLLVSSPTTGKVFRVLEDGSSSVVISGLNKPHGLAFKDGKLYIAETDAVAVYDYDGTAKNRKKLFDLPGGGREFTRTIGFGPDGRLYVSIGSSCNVCAEADARRASIQVWDGRSLRPFAKGLRNAVFFIWKGNDMYATDMGRDLLGDDLPPDTISIIKEGKNYGWPYCYGKQVWDKTFDASQKAADFCKTTEPSFVDLQAHSAPLGLAFAPETWPKAYKNSLLVAFHGSWNRSVPTGYKIVRLKLDEKGNYSGVEDFITGWLTNNEVLGRPVDLLFDQKGNLFISDDKAGVIYRVTRR